MKSMKFRHLKSACLFVLSGLCAYLAYKFANGFSIWLGFASTNSLIASIVLFCLEL